MWFLISGIIFVALLCIFSLLSTSLLKFWDWQVIDKYYLLIVVLIKDFKITEQISPTTSICIVTGSSPEPSGARQVYRPESLSRRPSSVSGLPLAFSFTLDGQVHRTDSFWPERPLLWNWKLTNSNYLGMFTITRILFITYVHNMSGFYFTQAHREYIFNYWVLLSTLIIFSLK